MKKIVIVLLSLVLSSAAYAQIPDSRYAPIQDKTEKKLEKTQPEVSLTAKLNKDGTAYEISIDSVHVCDLTISKINKGRQVFKCDSNYQLVAFSASNWLGSTYYSISVMQNGSTDVLAQIEVQVPRSLTPYEKRELEPNYIPPGKI